MFNINTNNNNNLSELEKSLSYLNDETAPSLDIQGEIGLTQYVKNLIKNNICSTITIKYNMGEVYVIAVYPSDTKLIKFSNHTEDSYMDFCKELLKISPEKYNCSRSLDIENVQTRVYAMMPPLTTSPIITISTTKTPPAVLSKQTIPDEAWNEIVHSNFIICGASGSGKSVARQQIVAINKRD